MRASAGHKAALQQDLRKRLPGFSASAFSVGGSATVTLRRSHPSLRLNFLTFKRAGSAPAETAGSPRGLGLGVTLVFM